MYSPFCSRSVSRSRATFQKGPSGIFSSLLARAAHTPELCSGVVAVLLEYAQKGTSIQQLQSVEQMRLPCLLYIGIISYIIIIIHNFIPYFFRSTLPQTTSIPSSISSSACFPAPPNANSPASSPFELTTL